MGARNWVYALGQTGQTYSINFWHVSIEVTCWVTSSLQLTPTGRALDKCKLCVGLSLSHSRDITWQSKSTLLNLFNTGPFNGRVLTKNLNNHFLPISEFQLLIFIFKILSIRKCLVRFVHKKRLHFGYLIIILDISWLVRLNN